MLDFALDREFEPPLTQVLALVPIGASYRDAIKGLEPQQAAHAASPDRCLVVAVQRLEGLHVLGCEPDAVVLDGEPNNRLEWGAAGSDVSQVELFLRAAVDCDPQAAVLDVIAEPL